MPKRREPKFYQTPEFKELYEIWVTGNKSEGVASKLEESGFEDIENPNGSLKVKNKRTQNYRQQDDLRRISSALTAYLEHSEAKLKTHERVILELHAQGFYRKKIMEVTEKSHTTVWRVLKRYTPLALGFYARREFEDVTLRE